MEARASDSTAAIFELAKVLPEAVLLLSGEGEILGANPPAAAMLGLGAPELRGKSLYDLATDPSEEIERGLRAWSRTRTLIPGSLTWRAADGQVIDCRCDGAVVQPPTEDSATVIFLRCVPKAVSNNRFLDLNRDLEALRNEYRRVSQINARLEERVEERTAQLVRYTEKLRESKEWFNSIVKNTSDIVWVARADGTLSYVSPSVERILGYRPEDLIDTYGFDLIHPDDVAWTQSFYDDVLERPGAIPSVEFRLRRNDGSWCHTESTGSNLLQDPSVSGVVFNSRDITDRKRAEEEENLLRTIALETSEAETLESALSITLRRVCEATDWAVGQAWIPSNDETKLECRPAWYVEAEDLNGFRTANEGLVFKPGEGLPGGAWSTKQPVWSRDIRKSSFLRAPIAEEFGLKAGADIPVLADSEVVAVLDFFMFEQREKDERLIELVSGIATQLGSVIQRKRSEEALRESEGRNRAVVDTASDAIITMSKDGIIRSFNPSAERIFGYGSEEIVGQPLRVLMPERFRKPHEAGVRRYLDTGEAHLMGKGPIELAGLRKNGEEFPLELSLGEMRTGDDLMFTGIIRDITKRKRAQKALQASEERLRRLVEQAADALFVHDLEGRFVNVNRQACESLGYTQEELLNLSMADVEENFHSTGIPKLWEKIIAGGPLTIDGVHRRKDGTRFPVEVRVGPFETGESRLMLAMARDVTERKRAEEDLSRLAAIVKTSKDAIVSGTLDGIVTTWNPGAEKLFGYTAEEMVGRPASILIPSDQRQELWKSLEEIEQGRSVEIDETVRVTKDGERIWVSVTLSPIKDSKGNVTGASRIIRDITERKRAEEALRESEAGLARAQQVAHLGSWKIDLITGEMHWSDEMYRVFGFAPGEVTPTREILTEATHPQDREVVPGAIRNAIEKRQPFNIDHRILHSDGEVRFIQAQGVAVFDPGGKPIGLVGTSLDITERRQVEEDLRKSEVRNRAILEATPDLMFRVSRDGEYLDFQANDDSKLYVPGEEIVGRNLRGTMPEELATLMLRRIAKTLDTEEMQFLEYQLPLDNDVLDFEARLVVSDSDEILAIVRDITERKRAEEELRESESRLLAAQRIASVGNWSFDVTTNKAYWSDELYRIFGLSPQEEPAPTYKRFLYRVHPGDRALVQEASREALEGGSRSSIDCRVVRSDGEFRFTHSEYEVKYDASGRAVELIGTLQDVTELRRVEAKLREQAQILDLAPVLIRNLDNGILLWNTGAERIYGWTREEAMGKVTHELLRSEHPEPVEQIRRKILQEGRWEGEITHTRKDGGRVVVSSLQVLHTDEPGEPRAILEVNTDITERKLAQKALEENEQKYRTLVEQIPVVTYIQALDHNNSTQYISPQVETVLGYSAREYTSTPNLWISILHPDDRERVLAEDERTDETLEPYKAEYRMFAKDGRIVWVQDEAVVVRDAAGRPRFWQGVMLDVTEGKIAGEALRRSEERFRSLVQNSLDVIAVVDAEVNVLYYSPSLEAVLGYKPEEFVGKHALETIPIHPDDLHQVQQDLAYIFDNPGISLTMEIRLRHADGNWRVMEVDGQNLIDDPSVGGLLANFRDITERKRAEEQLEYQAFYDTLTDLPNRTLFVDRVDHALAGLGRMEDKAVAMLFIDLDNFKVVNDSLGHTAGDQLLIAVARRLRSCMRAEDTVARFGGDEFAILLKDVEEMSDAARVAERILEELQTAFTLGGREVFVSSSIGISLSATASDRAEDLLRDADTALHQAKVRGKARHAVFDSEMYTTVLKRLRLESDLRRALEQGEFRVYYQPKMKLSTDLQRFLRVSGSRAIVARKQETMEAPRIVGTEALIRWEHPEVGLVSPAEFIPVAEETGLIVQIGRWVLKEACFQTRRWNDQHPSHVPFTVCVNLSARQFHDPGLCQDVARVLLETGLNPQCLCLEITESAVMKDVEVTVVTLQELKSLGVELSVDDFGTGFSSLSYLKRFPVDYLKIDRSFVEDLKKGSGDAMLVSGIIQLAHTLGMQVVAEGVESVEQLKRLQGLGCDLAQGFYFSEALPGEAMTGLLADDQQR